MLVTDLGRADASHHNLALAVADVNWFSTANLFHELDSEPVSILALTCIDYRNGWRRGLYPWSAGQLRRTGSLSWARDLVLPSGWMKRFPRVGMRPIARAVRRFWTEAGTGCRRGLLMTYPHYLFLHDQVRPDVAIYYALDDYTHYWPGQAEQVRRLERELVRRVAATVCVAKARALELREAVPEAAARIHHIPHGTPRAFLADRPWKKPAPAPADIADLPRPLLGYIGTMEDRVDWTLVNRLSREWTDASIVLVGRSPDPDAEPWHDAFRAVCERPNVRLLGWRPQADLPRYYACLDASLIPYRLDHPFNKSCSPTKIMDSMGSGRPMVATAIPECRLYKELFDVAEDHEEFLASIRSILANNSDDGRARNRHEHARANTCGHVARRLLATVEPVMAPRG